VREGIGVEGRGSKREFDLEDDVRKNEGGGLGGLLLLLLLSLL
jgi:hypothetical protein